MTKAEVINEVSIKTNIEKHIVEAVFEATIKVMRKNVAEGKTIHIRGFGSMGPRLRKGKVGRNIKANTAIVIPPRYVVAFTPADTWNDAVKQLPVAKINA